MSAMQQMLLGAGGGGFRFVGVDSPMLIPNTIGGPGNLTSIPVPSFAKPGDFLVAFVTIRGATFASQVSNGWTLYFNTGTGNIRFACLARTIDPVKPSSYDISFSANNIAIVTSVAFRSALVDPNSPGSIIQQLTSNGSMVYPNSLAVAGGYSIDAVGMTAATSSAGFGCTTPAGRELISTGKVNNGANSAGVGMFLFMKRTDPPSIAPDTYTISGMASGNALLGPCLVAKA